MTSEQIRSVTELEDKLSEPTDADIALMKGLKGDVLLLGAGGKMGPSLAKLARRAADAAGAPRRIVAVSRFHSEAARHGLESAGITTMQCDLLNPSEIATLPRCENVLYLAGRKFGSSGRPDLTWAMNAIAPSLAATHFLDSRIVVFSTGNIYGLQDLSASGSVETDLPAPVGEYAQSCLARERIFEYYSREYGTRGLLFRLNYATDLRYGVLVDIALRVKAGEPVPLTVPAFNVIWQRDANSYALRCLELCTSPPQILNVTGPETVSVRHVAEFFGTRFRREPRFGEEGGAALLSDASRSYSLLGRPTVQLNTLLEWVADWVGGGKEALDKPTHFEVADGKVLKRLSNMSTTLRPSIQTELHRGVVIPAHPLALTAQRKLDERRQVALTRYYCDAGAGGIAVGVHTTQFAIRTPGIDLFEPVLRLTASIVDSFAQRTGKPMIKVAGICGQTKQAVREAQLARDLGYDVGLLSLGAMPTESCAELLMHCRRVSEEIPLFGFYLQPAAGGRELPFEFWREFCEVENLAAIKVAPFNRYKTLDVCRALIGSGRSRDIALYTGNDDNIIPDLMTECRLQGNSVRFAGGLLGQWAVWTRRAVELLNTIKAQGSGCDAGEILARSAELTDANSVLFDVKHQFAGCIAGLHEILRRQGLLVGRWCLDPCEDLSPGQMEEIDRICTAYPHLTDDDFVQNNLDQWLK